MGKGLKNSLQKPKLDWLDRRRMRVCFLCLYVILAIVIFLTVTLVIFLINRDQVFDNLNPTDKLYLQFEEAADMELRFQYDEKLKNPIEIHMHPHVRGACTAEQPTSNPNRFLFTMNTPRSKIVNPKAEDFPCWVTIYLQPGTTLPEIDVSGTTQRRVHVRTVDEPQCKASSGKGHCFFANHAKHRQLDINGNEAYQGFVINGNLKINGTVFSVQMNNTAVNSVYARTVVGDVVFDNVRLGGASEFHSKTNAVLVRSTNDMLVSYTHPNEYLCMEGPAAPSPGPCLAFSSCPPEEFNCTISCQSRSIAVTKTGFPDASTVPVSMSSELGTIYATTYVPGTNLRTTILPHVYQGSNPPTGIKFIPEHEKEINSALHGDIAYDMFRIRIDTPGSPRGGLTTIGKVPTFERFLWLWGRRDIFLRVHPPVLDMASGGLLNPVTFVHQASLGPSFCPAYVPAASNVDFKEQRMAAIWRLLRETANPDVDTNIAIREGCLGNSVFIEDPVTDTVSREPISWTTHSLTIAVGLTSFILSLTIGVAVGIITKVVYISQTKKKREEILLRFRSLKSQGYFSLGGGYYLYHSPPDAHRWKRDFYVSDPFGRISTVRSMKEYRGFGDVFRALNSQRYQTLKIQLEDEAQVRRARKRRRDAELAAAVAMSAWYRENWTRRTITAFAQRTTEEVRLQRERREKRQAILSKAQQEDAVVQDDDETLMTAEEREQRRLDAENKERARRRAEEIKEQERREAIEKKEQSKMEARTKKQERTEEEELVKFFVGPFLFMEIFLETLFVTFWPGMQRRRDFDADATTSIKRLVTINSRANFANALTLALRISNKDLRQKAVDHIKEFGKDQTDVLNKVIRHHQSKQAWACFRWLKKVFGEERAVQFFVVTSHVLCQLLPPIVLILFGFILATKWGESPITANCSVFVFRAVYSFFVGFIFYFIAFAKLVFFYMEINNKPRLRLRKAYHIYSLFTIICSITLLMIFAFWVMLGLLLKPEIAGPPATAIGTMAVFVITQYRAVMGIRDNVKKALESYMNEKFRKKLEHLENKADILDRVIVQLGLSVRNIIVMLFGAAVFLALVFLFIFLGIAVFEGKGAASALIQSSLSVVAGVGVSFMKGKEAGDMKDKLKLKVPNMLKELINSVLQRGIDLAAPKKPETGGAKKTNKTAQDDLDIDITSSLYGAMQKVGGTEIMQNSRELEIIKVGAPIGGAVADPTLGIKRFWGEGNAKDHAVNAGFETSRSDVSGMTSRQTARTARVAPRAQAYSRLDDQGPNSGGAAGSSTDPSPPALIQDKDKK